MMQVRTQATTTKAITPTESGDLPEGWIIVRLSEGLVLDIQPGFACGVNNREGRGIGHLRPMNVDRDGLTSLSDLKYVPTTEADREERLVRKGDVIFNNTNSTELVGKTAYFALDKPLAFSNHMTRIRSQDDVLDPRYCALSLHQLWREGHFQRVCNNHVSQSSVSRAVLLDTKIPLPPLAEQKRIVEKVEQLLARVNAARERLARVPAILKRFRQAVLTVACSGRLTADWRTSSSEAATDDLGSWKECKLAELLREPLRNGHSARESRDGSGIRSLTLSAVTYGDFSLRNTKLTVADPRKVSDLWLKPGDILIERSNTPELVGTARLYKGAPDLAIFPDLLIRVRVGQEAQPEYVELVLQTDDARKYFTEEAQGTQGSMPKIDQQTILDFLLLLPPPHEQREIVCRAEALFKLADAIEKRVAAGTARADKLTQAILAKAFRGELVPTEAELARREGRPYEPASALLDRIRVQLGVKTQATPVARKLRQSNRRPSSQER